MEKNLWENFDYNELYAYYKEDSFEWKLLDEVIKIQSSVDSTNSELRDKVILAIYPHAICVQATVSYHKWQFEKLVNMKEIVEDIRKAIEGVSNASIAVELIKLFLDKQIFFHGDKGLESHYGNSLTINNSLGYASCAELKDVLTVMNDVFCGESDYIVYRSKYDDLGISTVITSRIKQIDM